MQEKELSMLTINKLSQKQYDRELEAGNLNEDELYLTPYEEQIIDSELSSTSQNPIQNQTITNWISKNVKKYNLEISEDAVFLSENSSVVNDEQNKINNTNNTNYNVKYIDLQNGNKAFFKSDWENIYNKPSTYAPSSHIQGIETITGLRTELDEKAKKIHNHDDIYYTEAEIDVKVDAINSNINAKVPSIRTVNGKALSANITLSASDVKADATGTAESKVSSHNTSTTAHNDIRDLITNLTKRLNTLADSDDVTLDQMSELVEYIKANRSLIESVTTSKINVSDIVDNLTTNVSNKTLSAAQGVAIKKLIDNLTLAINEKANVSHKHAISDVTDLQATLNGKAATSHTHNLSTLINSLSTGTSTPTDDDYYISQYVGGGVTTTTYHRRPISTLWSYIKEKLATVAVSGSYNDLTNKPTIPTVGNGTITITQNGTARGTFTTNQSGNTTIALTDTDTNTTYSAGRGVKLSGTQFVLADTCTTVSDWNNATSTGWYMASNASNAPISNGGWFYGEVIAHLNTYVRQILYHFATDSNVDGTNCDRYERVKHNGTWGTWVNTTVRKAVPSDAKFTDTNTWRGVQNNLTSDSTSDSLTAAQGKVLKSLIDGKANTSHGTHVTYATVAPKAAGNAAVGTSAKVSREDHVHPSQTTISGNAGSATKLATSRTISLGTGVIGTATNFDGSSNITIPVVSLNAMYLNVENTDTLILDGNF